MVCYILTLKKDYYLDCTWGFVKLALITTESNMQEAQITLPPIHCIERMIDAACLQAITYLNNEDSVNASAIIECIISFVILQKQATGTLDAFKYTNLCIQKYCNEQEDCAVQKIELAFVTPLSERVREFLLRTMDDDQKLRLKEYYIKKLKEGACNDCRENEELEENDEKLLRECIDVCDGKLLFELGVELEESVCREEVREDEVFKETLLSGGISIFEGDVLGLKDDTTREADAIHLSFFADLLSEDEKRCNDKCDIKFNGL